MGIKTGYTWNKQYKRNKTCRVHSSPLGLAQGLAELDRQCSRVDGLNPLPAALGLIGVTDNVLQPSGLVFVFVGIGIGIGIGLGPGPSRRRTAGLRLGWEALVEEARVLRIGAIVGVGSL